LAKKTARKQARTRASVKKKTTARPKRKAASRKTAAKPSQATARKKTAARAAASRKRRAAPSPSEPSRLQSTATAARGAIAGAISAVAKRLPGRASEPDAIQMLEQEHRRFEDLLKRGEDSTDRARKERRELLATLTAELNAHELMEEKVLYPALQSHPEARDIVLEGYEEHHVADLIVEELKSVATDDEQWAAKFKVLKENIEHHIEEEEGEMFRVARGIFSRDQLQELAERMRALKPRSARSRTQFESRSASAR
jgi:hemerythrin-like domain-containing protein